LTPIFITGLDASALQILGQQLGPIGLPTAKALERDPNISLSHWHQRVHATGQNPPARMWDQLAAELFLANMAQAQWCWADPLALPLLDYWAAFDPAIRFVLVAESPLQTALRQQSSQAVKTVDTSATPAGVPAPATNIALHHWQQTHHALLRFALRHPQRCLLLWQHQTQNASAMAQALQSRWGLQLTVPGNSGTSAPPSASMHCALAQHLGQVLTQNHPNAQQLLADLQANVTPLPHTTASSANITSEPHELLARYQQLSELSQQAADIPALQLKIKTQTQKTAEAEKNRADLQVQHANQLSQLQTEHKQALTQALTQAQSQAQEQAKAAKVASDQQLSEQLKIQTELKQALTQALSQAQEQAKAAKAASDQQLSAQQKLQAEFKEIQVELNNLTSQNKTYLESINKYEKEFEILKKENDKNQEWLKIERKDNAELIFQLQDLLIDAEKLLLKKIKTNY
jgi:hypothetical protein